MKETRMMSKLTQSEDFLAVGTSSLSLERQLAILRREGWEPSQPLSVSSVTGQVYQWWHKPEPQPVPSPPRISKG